MLTISKLVLASPAIIEQNIKNCRKRCRVVASILKLRSFLPSQSYKKHKCYMNTEQHPLYKNLLHLTPPLLIVMHMPLLLKNLQH